MRSKITFRHDAASRASRERTDTPSVADRESELRALMTMASHDLKNPLATVIAYVDMLHDDYGEQLGQEFHDDLAVIERALRRMARLTQDLLDYARADRELDLRPTPLDHLADEIVADHVATRETGPKTARVTVAGTLPTVVADAGLLRHVLDNLIGNAIKYTPAGAVPEIEISAHTPAAGVTRIEVADRGIGIPAAERSRIFDAFHRCANSTGYPGTGLGLNICQRIIERHGGAIGVEPNAGGGSRFWFTLPRARPAAEVRNRPERSTQPGA